MEKQLLSERVQIERKIFSFDLRENVSGRFLRITEDIGGRKAAIIVPATGLNTFRQTLERAAAALKDN